jgi:hypothetical protein
MVYLPMPLISPSLLSLPYGDDMEVSVFIPLLKWGEVVKESDSVVPLGLESQLAMAADFSIGFSTALSIVLA